MSNTAAIVHPLNGSKRNAFGGSTVAKNSRMGQPVLVVPAENLSWAWLSHANNVGLVRLGNCRGIYNFRQPLGPAEASRLQVRRHDPEEDNNASNYNARSIHISSSSLHSLLCSGRHDSAPRYLEG